MRFLALLLLALLSFTAQAKLDPNRSIVVAFDRVYDGDTVVVRLDVLPEPLNKLRIRIEGIDTPEIKRGAKCPQEEERGQAARQHLAELLGSAKELRVYQFRWDKYGGRLLGDLRTPEGSMRELMIKSGLAMPYSGEGQRRNWCADAPQ